MISGISKWDGSKVVNRKDAYICGDAISDLRTTDNKLSVWKADTQEDINDAIVALALSRDSVSKLSYFFLKEEDLYKIEIKISDKQVGVAAGLDSQILIKHRDLIDLDYWRLGYLAEHLTKLAKDENNRKNCSASEVKKLLEKYKEEHKITPNQMKDKLKEKLKW
ncbi:hypothetical protein AB9N12_01360 [Bacteroides sp. AN502(2024)]|uniref:hypothetical protein n=1 Tax=Bacteroides sp. AN502(2024) TaxID=3160599 RepID=UPI0035116906